MNKQAGISSKVKIPNTFVIGAPKCGTTAMCDFLGRHPGAFVCSPKEPHFFVKEEMPRQGMAAKLDLEKYEGLFEGCSTEHKIRAEGSVWYLYSQTALANIHKYNSRSKIIVMLRRPDEMVYSMHNEAVASYNDDIVDFSKAWEISMNGNQRNHLPELCREPTKLHYNKIACYAEQLERVYRHFPENQVHVIFYDDFSKDTKLCYQKLLQFLGLEPFEIDFHRINENHVNKNYAIGRFLRTPPEGILQIATLIKKITGARRLGWRDKLSGLNSKKAKREPLDESIRQQILSVYESDILRLQELCNRDLSHWLV